MKGFYKPDSYYRYRRDNELSSSNSLKAVRFFYQEYKRLMEKCGFLDYTSFIRAFKRSVGVSPGQYKKAAEHSDTARG